MPFLCVFEFFPVSLVVDYIGIQSRTEQEKNVVYIYAFQKRRYCFPPPHVHVLKNRIINGSSFSSSFFRSCFLFTLLPVHISSAISIGFVLRSFLSVVWVFRIGERM